MARRGAKRATLVVLATVLIAPLLTKLTDLATNPAAKWHWSLASIVILILVIASALVIWRGDFGDDPVSPPGEHRKILDLLEAAAAAAARENGPDDPLTASARSLLDAEYRKATQLRQRRAESDSPSGDQPVGVVEPVEAVAAVSAGTSRRAGTDDPCIRNLQVEERPTEAAQAGVFDVDRRLSRHQADMWSIGIVAVSLPFVLMFGNDVAAGHVVLPTSISSFYYRPMRDVLVGGLCAIGAILMSIGYGWLEDILAHIAGGLAVASALFPTAEVTTVQKPHSAAVGLVHLGSTSVLILVTAVMCLLTFPASVEHGVEVTPRGRRRNQIYKVCGWVVIAGLVAALVSSALPANVRAAYHPLLWAEAVWLYAFGVACLVRGGAVLRD